MRIEGEAAWQCPDKFNCPPQIAGRVEHFVGRKMMNIEGIGEETARQLYDAGLVRNIADLYDLQPSQLERLEGFGRRSAEHAVESIRATTSVPYDRVIYALSIPYVGDTVAKKVARAFPDIDTLMAASAAELAVTKDIGPRIAESIVDYFGNPINRSIVERLRAAGLQMRQSEGANEGRTDLLQGKSFVISGVFALHSRDEYKAMIELNGGKNVGSISKKTDYVLAGDNMGPAKREKASSLGIPIIDEQQFLAMLKPADFGSAEADGQTNG